MAYSSGTPVPRSSDADRAVDVQVELHQAEQDLVARLRRLPKAKVDVLPWSIRKALRHLKRVQAKAEATPGYPVF